MHISFVTIDYHQEKAGGGVASYVRTSVTGIFVPPGDGTALARAMVRLLEDAALRQRMGRAGRERAYSCFAADRIVEETSAAYSRVLASSAARPVPAAIEENG